jgi:hypothetical protein
MNDIVETGVDAIYNRLTTGVATTLATRITAINTEKGDSLLDALSTSLVFKGRRYLLDNFPCIVIWPESSPIVEISPETIDATATFIVWVVATADDAEDLQQKIWRYLRAITEHLCNDWTLGDAVDKMDLLDYIYESPWAPEFDRLGYIDAGGLRIKVHNEVSI